MSLFKDYQAFILQQINFSKLFQSNSYSWNGKYFQHVKTKSIRVILPICTIAIYLMTMTIRLVGIFEGDNAFIDNIPALAMFISVSAAYAMGILLLGNTKESAAFLNRIAKFELDLTGETYQKLSGNKFSLIKTYLTWMKEDSLNGKIGRWIHSVGVGTAISMPTFTFALLLVAPCTNPAFLRSTLSDCPVRKGFPVFQDSLLLKVIFGALDVHFVGYGFSRASVAVVDWYSGSALIREYIERIPRNKSDKEELIRRIQLYKKIQLLENNFNYINASGLIPLILTDMAVLSTLTLYTLIALHSELSLPLLLFIFVLAADVAFFIQGFCYAAAGNMHKASSELLEFWNHSKDFNRDKLLRKWVRSLSVLKVRIGKSGNYFEISTPLSITDFTFGQVITLLLANP